VHVALCGLAALLTAAPFSVALLMPDIFAPATVLALAMLGLAPGRLGRGERLYLSALATFAIASHLSHLPLAAALVATTLGVDLALRRRVQAHRVAAPLLAALALLAATNLAGHGRVAISPHGATFMLARLQDDGPATATLRAHCPREGWTLCVALDRLPMDSDEFLWSPDSPVNRDASGAPRFLGGAALSAEAGEVVAATLRERPLEVAVAMAGNAWRQFWLVEPGDTLGPEWLGQIATRLREGFGAREADAFEASLQARGELREALLPMVPPQLPVLVASLAALAFAGWRARRDADARRSTFALAVPVALVANACPSPTIATRRASPGWRPSPRPCCCSPRARRARARRCRPGAVETRPTRATSRHSWKTCSWTQSRPSPASSRPTRTGRARSCSRSASSNALRW
jgi:hypothetical protein